MQNKQVIATVDDLLSLAGDPNVAISQVSIEHAREALERLRGNEHSAMEAGGKTTVRELRRIRGIAERLATVAPTPRLQRQFSDMAALLTDGEIERCVLRAMLTDEQRHALQEAYK